MAAASGRRTLDIYAVKGTEQSKENPPAMPAGLAFAINLRGLSLGSFVVILVMTSEVLDAVDQLLRATAEAVF